MTRIQRKVAMALRREDKNHGKRYGPGHLALEFAAREVGSALEAESFSFFTVACPRHLTDFFD